MFPDGSLPLGGLVVVERSLTIAGGFAGRQLADAGARVIAMRSPHPEWFVDHPSRELRQYLDAGKTVVEDSDEDTFTRLAAAADIVLWESATVPDASLVDSIARERVLVVITPRGRSGPRIGQPWTEFSLQAESGSMHLRGLPDREPLQSGSAESLWLAGAAAATAALIGLHGGPSVLDVSLLVAGHAAFNCFMAVGAQLAQERDGPRILRRRMQPSIERAADGWVGFNLATAQNLEDFMVMIDRPDMLGDDELRSAAGRYNRQAS